MFLLKRETKPSPPSYVQEDPTEGCSQEDPSILDMGGGVCSRVSVLSIDPIAPLHSLGWKRWRTLVQGPAISHTALEGSRSNDDSFIVV